MKFWFPWAISAMVGATFIAFFFIGLADGSVSAFNLGLWVVILAAVGGCVGGSLWLRKHGRALPSVLLAWVLAVPGLFGLLFLLLVLILQPRWN